MSNATDRENIYVIVCIEGFVVLLVVFLIKGCQRRMSHHKDDASFCKEDILTSDHGKSL